jgi:uncharacterized membrane-anchored protein
MSKDTLLTKKLGAPSGGMAVPPLALGGMGMGTKRAAISLTRVLGIRSVPSWIDQYQSISSQKTHG